MQAQRRVEARRGKHDEALGHAEVCGGHKLYAQRAGKHYPQRDTGAYPV